MKKNFNNILNVLKPEYVISIIIFLTVVYKNMASTIWFVGVSTLILNLYVITDKNNTDLKRWRTNVNALFSILLIIESTLAHENLYLFAGCIGFIICILNLTRINK